jgi:hypothetical protein
MAGITISKAPRIFFDTNEGSQEGGYRLELDRSKMDIDAIGPAITEGVEVIIYMPNELEMAATLSQHENGFWLAMPIPGTIKYLDGSE